jgi:hypothetical protein
MKLLCLVNRMIYHQTIVWQYDTFQVEIARPCIILRIYF